jgi:hypothetical protein
MGAFRIMNMPSLSLLLLPNNRASSTPLDSDSYSTTLQSLSPSPGPPPSTPIKKETPSTRSPTLSIHTALTFVPALPSTPPQPALPSAPPQHATRSRTARRSEENGLKALKRKRKDDSIEHDTPTSNHVKKERKPKGKEKKKGRILKALPMKKTKNCGSTLMGGTGTQSYHIFRDSLHSIFYYFTQCITTILMLRINTFFRSPPILP